MEGVTTKLIVSDRLARARDLTDRFTPEELDRIGAVVWRGYELDKASRAAWERRMEAGMDLALQIQKDRNFPWPGCSNIAFPLITIATLQWHSQAYPQLVRTPNVVKYRTTVSNADGREVERARRIEAHMSYQILEEDEAWEEQHDRLLINLPIMGTAFKKIYYSGELGHNVSELVLAQDLVLNYYAKSLDTCGRKTQIIPLYRNDIIERIGEGIFRDVREEAWFGGPARPLTNVTTQRQDVRHGETPPQADDITPFTTLEQHCLFDFDGDGYMEPYIITIEASSKAVLRIVANWDSDDQVVRDSRGRITRITPTQYYEKYTFIPSPDNSIYDLGWGVLLGPLNESVNTLLNQLVDAGTMSNTGGGFLGRGAKIRGGAMSFAPLEWKRVDSTGDDLRKNIMPLPVREPSNVLFQLLGLLINYTQRVSGTTDTIVGENPGQNTPASTTQTLVRQGMKIYNAIYKRVWRSMRHEFRKLYILNGRYLSDTNSLYGMEGRYISRQDYLGNPAMIAPEADPNITSTEQAQARAMFVKEQSMSTPGYDRVAVEKDLLRAFEIDNQEVLFPGPDKVPPLPNPKAQIEQIKLQGKQMEIQYQQQKFIMELQEERKRSNAQILLWQAQAAKLLEEAGGVKDGHEIAAFEAVIGAAKTHNDMLTQRIETMMKMMESGNAGSSDVGRLAATPGDKGTPGALPPAPGDAEGSMG